jgi:hypothetical protein
MAPLADPAIGLDRPQRWRCAEASLSAARARVLATEWCMSLASRHAGGKVASTWHDGHGGTHTCRGFLVAALRPVALQLSAVGVVEVETKSTT